MTIGDRIVRQGIVPQNREARRQIQIFLVGRKCQTGGELFVLGNNLELPIFQQINTPRFTRSMWVMAGIAEVESPIRLVDHVVGLSQQVAFVLGSENGPLSILFQPYDRPAGGHLFDMARPEESPLLIKDQALSVG